MSRCTSPFLCRNDVASDGDWCSSCQGSAASSREIGAWVNLARVQNLDTRYQSRIATHPSPLVRLIFLERTDLIDPVRSALLHDADETVLRMAAAKLADTPEHDLYMLLYRDTAELQFALAGNEFMPLQGLQKLCTHPDPVIAARAEETLLVLARRQQRLFQGGTIRAS